MHCDGNPQHQHQPVWVRLLHGAVHTRACVVWYLRSGPSLQECGGVDSTTHSVHVWLHSPLSTSTYHTAEQDGATEWTTWLEKPWSGKGIGEIWLPSSGKGRVEIYENVSGFIVVLSVPEITKLVNFGTTIFNRFKNISNFSEEKKKFNDIQGIHTGQKPLNLASRCSVT